jgi:di/tricarboxylate transporter
MSERGHRDLTRQALSFDNLATLHLTSMIPASSGYVMWGIVTGFINSKAAAVRKWSIDKHLAEYLAHLRIALHA